LIFLSAFACFCFSCLLFILLISFIFPSFSFFGCCLFSVLSFSFESLRGNYRCNFPIGSHRIFISSSFLDLCLPNPHVSDVLRSNALLEPNWRPILHALNSASQSDLANVTAQEGGNASPAMNDVLPGTTTKCRRVPMKAPDSMRANSESRSNEIDESEKQYEKHDEQRI
jgi:hypothetical protein